jgi:hypothetical protein
MSQPTQPATPRRANNILLIAGVVLLLVAIAAGVYYGFFAGRQAPEMATVGEAPLIEQATAPSDLQAYLDRTLTPEQKQRLAYRVEGNRMLDVAASDPETGGSFKAREIEFKALDTANAQPHFVDMRIKGLEIVLPAERAVDGLEKISGSMIYAYSYDPATRTLEVPAVQLAMDGLATLGFTGSFTEVTLFAGTPDEALAGVAGGKIKAFTFQLRDETLLRGLLEETARSQGTDLASMRTQGVAMLTILESQVTGSIEKQALAAARVILDKEGGVTLTVIASPAEPFPFAQFMLIGQSGGGLPDLSALEPLNLTITAE